jgi:hypothetical protein
MSNGIEFAGVLLLFFFAGLGLDVWLGTKPWITVGMTCLGIVGMLARAFYSYRDEMAKHEAARQAPSPPAAPSHEVTS